jgi:hypothetical protein
MRPDLFRDLLLLRSAEFGFDGGSLVMKSGFFSCCPGCLTCQLGILLRAFVRSLTRLKTSGRRRELGLGLVISVSALTQRSLELVAPADKCLPFRLRVGSLSDLTNLFVDLGDLPRNFSDPVFLLAEEI